MKKHIEDDFPPDEYREEGIINQKTIKFLQAVVIVLAATWAIILYVVAKNYFEDAPMVEAKPIVAFVSDTTYMELRHEGNKAYIVKWWSVDGADTLYGNGVLNNQNIEP